MTVGPEVRGLPEPLNEVIAHCFVVGSTCSAMVDRSHLNSGNDYQRLYAPEFSSVLHCDHRQLLSRLSPRCVFPCVVGGLGQLGLQVFIIDVCVCDSR